MKLRKHYYYEEIMLTCFKEKLWRFLTTAERKASSRPFNLTQINASAYIITETSESTFVSEVNKLVQHISK